MCHGFKRDPIYDAPALGGLFETEADRKLPEDIHRDMLRVEAQECGLLADDAVDARTIPDDVLDELGLTAEEVGQ